MKLGFDIHGVVDTFEVFPQIINQLADIGVEIHVITGLSRAEADKEIGHLIDLSKVKYFSVADYLMSRPDVEVTWENGMPWAPDKDWDRAKADYCHEEGITALFDDSPTYAKFFDKIDTIYCQIHNPNRKRFKKRTSSK